MKVLLTTTLLALASVLPLTLAHSQYTQISTNPSSLLFGVFKVEVEIPAANRWAFETEFALMSKGQRFWTPDYETKGYRAGFSLKRYFDATMPNEGYYGFMYMRHSALAFTDFAREDERYDQRDFDRIRTTLGFGAGYTKVHKDGFFYGCALGIGRHVGDTKKYTSSVPGQTVSEALDGEIFEMPIDVYGRISIGVRLFNSVGAAQKEAYELEQEELREELRDQLYNSLNGEYDSPLRDMSELELRRLRHRIKNGNG